VIPVETQHLPVASESHPGETGKNNEDAFSVSAYRLDPEGTPVLLAIVADGVGGHRAGEIASRMVVEIVSRQVGESSGRDPMASLRSAVVEAGRAVSTAAEALPEQQGMASTIAVAWIIGRRLYTAYTGDSRIYLRRRGRLQQATIDHSWVQEAIEHQIIAPEEARGHPHAHILRKYLGGNLEPQPDFRLRLAPGESDRRSLDNQGVALEPGDQVFLCSDGLTDLVPDKEIDQALASRAPAEAVASLVVLARARGGHDNITVILIAVPDGRGTPPRRRRSRLGVLASAVAGLVLIVLLAIAALLWFGLWPWG
jgi:protein phosphatase